MKAILFYSFAALIGNALALNVEPNALLARDIDPQTMDPVRLSVLKVLRTAMPLGFDAPMPTGDSVPPWYANLPEDVKNALPGLYPIQASVTSAAPSSETSALVSSTAIVTSSPTATVSSSAGHTDTTSIYSLAVTKSASANSSSTAVSSLWASHLNLTETLYHASTGIAAPTNSSSNGTLTVPTASPSPSTFFSTGAKTKVETLAAVTWLALGASFFLLA